MDVAPSPAGCAGALSAHQVAIEHIKRKFEHDKKVLERYYKSRDEEETKKRQVEPIFDFVHVFVIGRVVTARVIITLRKSDSDHAFVTIVLNLDALSYPDE